MINPLFIAAMIFYGGQGLVICSYPFDASEYCSVGMFDEQGVYHEPTAKCDKMKLCQDGLGNLFFMEEE